MFRTMMTGKSTTDQLVFFLPLHVPRCGLNSGRPSSETNRTRKGWFCVSTLQHGEWLCKIKSTIVTKIITKLIRWEFSPVMFWSKITELLIGEFSSGGSLQDLALGNSVQVSSDRWTARYFRWWARKTIKYIHLGILSGNDPVKNYRK